MGKGLHLFEHNWNPITGCTKYSAGCKNCYALDRVIPQLTTEKYKNGALVTCHNDLLDVPRRMKKPKSIIVNNMGDLFHDDVPLSFLKELFKTMNECPRHTFYPLTKRTPRMLELSPHLNWSSNIVMGVTVEDAEYKFRIDDLRKVPVKRRFIMFEPLIGSIGKIDLVGFELVLVGGESGIGFRKMDIDWAREIRDQVVAAGVKFNFMQYAAVDPCKLGRELDGKIWNELPNDDHQLELF